MLGARSVALVGASPRSGSLAERALIELDRSPRPPTVHLVNPLHAGRTVGGRTVVASLDDVGEPVDLVLCAVGDARLEKVLSTAARRGDRSAVVFASAFDPGRLGEPGAFRARLAQIATDAGMALCGGGCMGFVSRDLRAIGYLEPAPLPTGPIALVTCSGSAFSALLRADRPFGWSLAVSSGQELVTTAGDYLDHALDLPETRVAALVLEALHAPERLRAALARAAARDVAVVALTVGSSEAGRAMVTAHSGALAGSDGAWEALFDENGVIRVGDLHEMCDTLELLAVDRSRRARPPRAGTDGPGRRHGVAAVLDSGAERALLVDIAAELGVPFAEIGSGTVAALSDRLDPGLDASNPLDVWGRGASTEQLFTGCLTDLAADGAVDAVALAVDLVHEHDGDESYLDAVVAAAAMTDLPTCVLSHVPSAIDRAAARRLRSRGIPVLEGTRSGLLALRHLLERRDFAARPPVVAPQVDEGRRERWRERLATGPLTPIEGFELLTAYGIDHPPVVEVRSAVDAMAAASQLGYPVVLKTGSPEVAHKSEAGGVVLGLCSAGEVAHAYDVLAARLGPQALVMPTAPPGVEVAVGVLRDPMVGPLVVVGAGGRLVEHLSDRAVALAPLDLTAAERLVDRLRARPLLDGIRGEPPADLGAVHRAIVSVSMVATELGGALDALDVNPLSCGPHGALALDVLVEAPPASI